MNDEVLAERLTKVEESAKSAHHRIDEVKEITSSIYALTEKIAIIITEVQHTNEDVKEIKNTVDNLNNVPLQEYKTVKTQFIGALMGAFGTAVAGGIIYLISL